MTVKIFMECCHQVLSKHLALSTKKTNTKTNKAENQEFHWLQIYTISATIPKECRKVLPHFTNTKTALDIVFSVENGNGGTYTLVS